MRKYYHHTKTILIVATIGLVTAFVTAFLLQGISNGAIELIRFEIDEKTTFLDFYTALLGGILGGVVTLAGVALTIMNSDRKHAEQLAIEYRPYLDAVKVEKSLESKCETICLINDLQDGIQEEEASRVDVHLMFTNKGRGFLSGWNMKTITPFNEAIKSSDLFMSPTYNFFMMMRFYVHPQKNFNGPFEYTLSYNDEFDNQYTQKLHFTITTKVIREGVHEFDVNFKDIGRQRRIK